MSRPVAPSAHRQLVAFGHRVSPSFVLTPQTVNGRKWEVKAKNGMKRKMDIGRDRDKPADLRLIVPRELARELRKRAKDGHRTIQAQALMELEHQLMNMPLGPSAA